MNRNLVAIAHVLAAQNLSLPMKHSVLSLVVTHWLKKKTMTQILQQIFCLLSAWSDCVQSQRWNYLSAKFVPNKMRILSTLKAKQLHLIYRKHHLNIYMAFFLFTQLSAQRYPFVKKNAIKQCVRQGIFNKCDNFVVGKRFLCFFVIQKTFQ